MSKTKIKWVVFDAEGDSLRPRKFHCLSYEAYDGKKETLTHYQDIRDFFSRYEMYVGHNIRRWDIPNLQRVVGIELGDASIVDTLGVTWYTDPDRPRHNLESFAEDYGLSKPEVDDWNSHKLSVYTNRCEKDVEINVALWRDKLSRLLRLYGDAESLLKFLRYLDFKMYSAHLAEESGWLLDIERTKESIKKLTDERDTKFEELRQAMPRVPVTRLYGPPKRRYNSDGQLSLLGQRWQERLIERGLPEGYDGEIEEIVGYDDPNPQSTQQVKAWLYSFGWVPETIKYTRDKKTGEIKETPQINLLDGSGICPSIEKLYEKEPKLELLDGLGVAKHRLGLLNGFLRDVDSDGYLHACVAGLTNTLRFKHAEIVNLPKPEKKYGSDIRGSLICPSGMVLCGSDMSSLEDRIKQHFIQPYDPDYVAELNRPDYDPHLDLAKLAGAVTEEEVKLYVAGDKPTILRIKPIRSIYKNGNYA